MSTTEVQKGKPVSRQRAWQLAKLEDGLCIICGDNPLGLYTAWCDECREKETQRQRERRARKKEAKAAVENK